MTRYMLAVHTNAEPRQPMSEEEMRSGMAQIGALEQEMKDAGALVFSARLDGPSAARVVRATGGKVITTDGPFAEAKEVIGGFYIIEAPDDDAALGWAGKTSAAISMPIEVRPFMDWREE